MRSREKRIGVKAHYFQADGLELPSPRIWGGWWEEKMYRRNQITDFVWS